MTWYAVDAIDAAVEEVKDFLLPFDWQLWAKIALLVLFTSGLHLPGGGNYSVPSPNGQTGANQVSGAAGALIGTGPAVTGLATTYNDVVGPRSFSVLMLLALVVVGFMIVGAVFDFIYYRSLRANEVSIKQYFREYFEFGLRLFTFRILTLVGAIIVGVLVYEGVMAYQSSALVAAVVIVGIPALILFLIFVQLTNEFIPLVMMDHDLPVIPAWKQFYGTLSDQWQQVGVYVILRVILNIAVGIIVALASVLLFVPAIIVGMILLYVHVPNTILLVLAAIALVVWYVVSLVIIRVPAQTYLRYYTILVYQKLTA